MATRDEYSEYDDDQQAGIEPWMQNPEMPVPDQPAPPPDASVPSGELPRDEYTPDPDPQMGGRFGYDEPRDNTPPPAPAPAPPPAPAPAPAPAAPGPTAEPDVNNQTPVQPGTTSLYDAVANLYRNALGREGSPQDIQAWIAGTQGNLAAIQQGIYGSPEGQAYSKTLQQQGQTPPAATGARPTGGQLTDPAFAAKLVAWAGSQPGVNPSVKNDPQYWIGRFNSGAFGNDQDYAVMRMMQPEGPPEGARTAAPAAPGAATTPPAWTGTSSQSAGGNYTPPPMQNYFAGPAQSALSQQFGSDVRNQLLNLLQQAPVSEGDQDIAPAISAYRNARMRALRETQDQNAESANARGLLHSGAYDAATARDNEMAGGQIASFSGNLVAQQALARRNQITQLLQMSSGLITADQEQALRAQIANIDAFMNQQRITNEYNYNYDRLSQDASQFGVTANNNALRTALGI